jgi:hypothetical protein
MVNCGLIGRFINILNVDWLVKLVAAFFSLTGYIFVISTTFISAILFKNFVS